MNGRDFATLRERAGLTQASIEAALGVTTRTITSWERDGEKKSFSPMDRKAIQDLFTPLTLDPRLSELVELAVERIPSELVAIWYVHDRGEEGSDVILRPAAVRSRVASPMSIQPLASASLTTFPLRTGRTLRLAGQAILDHPAKKYKTLHAQHFDGGLIHSLLHAPAFLPSSTGAGTPVLMLSFENKLEPVSETVIPADGAPEIYTAEDETLAVALASEFAEQLAPDLAKLDIVQLELPPRE